MCKYCDRFPVAVGHGTEGVWNEYFSKTYKRHKRYDNFCFRGNSLKKVDLETYSFRNDKTELLVKINGYPLDESSPTFASLSTICKYKDIELIANLQISYCPFCGKKLI